MDISALHRKESIILNAIELIDQFGIHSVSTKEIAKRLAISESTIFKHFPKKYDLLKAVLEQYSLYDSDIYFTSINKDNAKEALLFYIDSFLVYYENYPEITALQHSYEILTGMDMLAEQAKEIYFHRHAHMRELVERAIGEGVFKKEHEAGMLTDVIESTCRGICLRWRLSDKGFSLREETIKAVHILVDVFSVKDL